MAVSHESDRNWDSLQDLLDAISEGLEDHQSACPFRGFFDNFDFGLEEIYD